MSQLQLLNVNFLNNTYENTLDFATLQEQTDYFSSLVFSTMDLGDDYVYIREHREVQVEFSKSQLEGKNYLRFNNGSKWWYAFITRKDYINENLTNITFEIDVMQTFMLDYSLGECFVEREHQDRWESDALLTYKPKFNRIDEGLDYGKEYKVDKVDNLNAPAISNRELRFYLITATDPLTSHTTDNYSSRVGTPTINDGLHYYAIPELYNPTNNSVSNMYYYNDTGELIMRLEDLWHNNFGITISKIVDIQVVKYIPFNYEITFSGGKYIFQEKPSGADTGLEMIYHTYGSSKWYFYKISHQSHLNDKELATLTYQVSPVDLDITKDKNIANETKLLTDPYMYVNLDNNEGNPYKITIPDLYLYNLDSSADHKTYKVKYDVAMGASNSKKVFWIPRTANGDEVAPQDYAVVDGTENTVSYKSSKLQDYLAEHKNMATTGVAVNAMTDAGRALVGGALGTVYTGNPVAMLGAGVSATLGILDKVVNQSIKEQDLAQAPDNLRSRGNNSYANAQLNTGNLQLKWYSVLDYIKTRLYNFFFHFGYKCKEYKTPNLKSRYYFNYIKTIDTNIFSDIDNEYIDKLKSIYEKGITIWHYRDALTFRGVGDYQKENVEMSLITP